MENNPRQTMTTKVLTMENREIVSNLEELRNMKPNCLQCEK